MPFRTFLQRKYNFCIAGNYATWQHFYYVLSFVCLESFAVQQHSFEQIKSATKALTLRKYKNMHQKLHILCISLEPDIWVRMPWLGLMVVTVMRYCDGRWDDHRHIYICGIRSNFDNHYNFHIQFENNLQCGCLPPQCVTRNISPTPTSGLQLLIYCHIMVSASQKHSFSYFPTFCFRNLSDFLLPA